MVLKSILNNSNNIRLQLVSKTNSITGWVTNPYFKEEIEPYLDDTVIRTKYDNKATLTVYI